MLADEEHDQWRIRGLGHADAAWDVGDVHVDVLVIREDLPEEGIHEPDGTPLLDAVPHLAHMLALAGCAGVTWRTPQPGERLGPTEIVVVGSFAAVPPFEQYGPAPTSAVLVGELRGNLVAFFAPDLAERWNPSPMTLPLARADRALFPLRGYFLFVVPRAGTVYLRGVVLQTDTGADKYELPVRIDLAEGDRVVYIGELKLVRVGGTRLLVRDEQAAARRAVGEAGRAELVSLPWKTRLARQ